MKTRGAWIGMLALLAMSVFASGCCGPCAALCNPFSNPEAGNKSPGARSPAASPSQPAP